MILPKVNAQNDTLRDGLERMIKLIQTFEKLGYATDPYLGNLTVSPKLLGTAMKLEASFHFENKVNPMMDKEVEQEIVDGKCMHIENRMQDAKHNDVLILSQQTLAPSYNENL